MKKYIPDAWSILKINHDGDVFYKVLASWYGGFADGDSWRMNSGIDKVIVFPDYYEFVSASGTKYMCTKDTETMTGIMGAVYTRLKEAHGDSVQLINYKDMKL